MRSRRRIWIVGLALSFMMVHMSLAGMTALASSGVEDLGGNLFVFPVYDSTTLKVEFDQGNYFLYPQGLLPQESDGTGDVTITPAPVGSDSQSAVDGGEGDDSETDTPDEATVVATVARVMGSSVKLRATANSNADVVADLSDGTTLNILGKSGQWLQVSFGIMQGYVSSSNVFQVSTTGLNGYVMRDGVNLRAENNTDANILGLLTAGAGVKVTDYLNGWFLITYGDKNGYVRNDCIAVSSSVYTGDQSTLLKSGMSGSAVKKAQTELKRRGFFTGIASGEYGPTTEKAVEAFQAMANLDSDGILGQQTLTILYGNNNYYLRISLAQKVGVKGKVKMTDWNVVKNILPNGAKIKVIDVRTGVSWNEKVSCGHYHKDVSPLSASDTAKLKSVYGGKWTWARRPVWVVYRNYVWAASMNGMPHAPHLSVVSGNNFSGVHCIHFLNSRVHATGRVDSVHQACIKTAYNAGK